ncbi:ABC transporter ATP-binding protein [Aliiroseovarius crassostreae]|uniref:ABC transporter ATP-binding protein n=1 Tax=Aliiroseovarius crassostreae TaxID=154981 RepID=UPI00220AE664|nr:ABC transporter ATP-binding protein [Aliiroseovarius crassostreae]UWP90840.1 ABC transporter ATP-binding protein [Aliiroseovarius crassostreae]
MAKITLSNLRHSYHPTPSSDADYALKEIDLDWRDGGAYALLGPSGCGKSTLLNIISGLLVPSEGKVLFDGADVTDLPPDQRNIAQVFQFPVIYDTMSVYDNLAFPLRNRGRDEQVVNERVMAIAEMLEVTDMLDQKAAGLSPDNKQKISMGRGLVREDVNVVMFDEPLTVIDPHLKWKLRSKLKELHQRVRATMIYVTHDQTEALTFADQVVVMQDGEIVQIGTPVELFDRPAHTFVGHFIGSPGMNVLPCEVTDGVAIFAGHAVPLEGPITGNAPTTGTGQRARTEIGIRPEFVSIAPTGLPAIVTKVSDVGRHVVVECHVGDHRINAITEGGAPAKGDTVHLNFSPGQTRLYIDGWVATSPAAPVPEKEG